VEGFLFSIRAPRLFGLNQHGQNCTSRKWVVLPSLFSQRGDYSTVSRRLNPLGGPGQFRDSNGDILRERAMLQILLYPGEKRRDSSGRIEQIREAYKQAFQQESVLRADRRYERVGF
jgi:hypothetical protein